MRILVTRLLGLALGSAIFAMNMAAQTNTFPASGSVGIGTTTPNSQVEVYGSADQTTAALTDTGSRLSNLALNAGDASSGAGASITFGNAQSKAAGTLGWAAIKALLNSGAGNTYGDLGFSTRNSTTATALSERMRLTAAGNLGIGTATPSALLEVNGGIKMTNGSSGVLTFADGTTQNTGLNASTLLTGSGATASNYLQINANNGIPSYFGNVVNGQNDWSFNTYYNGSNWIYATANPTAGIRMGAGVGMMAFYTTVSGTAGAVNSTMDTTGPKMSLSLAGGLSLGNTYTSTDAGAGGLIVAGNVGIGTTAPTSALEVKGDVTLTSGKGGSIKFQDGSIQNIAWNGILSGGDYAESVDVSGSRSEYEPGDVLVIDPGTDGRVKKSSGEYSTAVTGIYSTKPGALGRRQHSDNSNVVHEVPMAMIGIVPTKVTAANGSIQPGDLLVTASMPGYAMKGTDRMKLTGAIVGKAMGHLDSGTGLIEVVVSLQ